MGRRGPEGKIQDKLRDHLNARGVLFKKQEVGRYFVKSGWPDFAIFPGGGRAFFIEVKAPDGEVTEIQEYVHEQLRKAKYAVYVVRDADVGKQIIDKECGR